MPRPRPPSAEPAFAGYALPLLSRLVVPLETAHAASRPLRCAQLSSCSPPPSPGTAPRLPPDRHPTAVQASWGPGKRSGALQSPPTAAPGSGPLPPRSPLPHPSRQQPYPVLLGDQRTIHCMPPQALGGRTRIARFPCEERAAQRRDRFFAAEP